MKEQTWLDKRGNKANDVGKHQVRRLQFTNVTIANIKCDV